MASVLGSILKKALGQPPVEQQPYLIDDPWAGIPLPGSGYTGGQPASPTGPIVIPAPMEKEIADLYLKVKTPKEDLTKLKGISRYWVFTNDETAVEVPTSNLNASGQREILEDLQIATDLDGCDNVGGLVQNLMLGIHARVLTNKARSDFTDGLRERIVPSVGVSLFGNTESFGRMQGERPRENRAIMGIMHQPGYR